MYSTTTSINLTPDELKDLVRGAVRSELANFTPPAPVGANLPEYLTRKDTAELLAVSLTTLHDWAKDSDDRPAVLIPLKVNGRVRYRRADVLAALKEVRRFKKTSVAGESLNHAA